MFSIADMAIAGAAALLLFGPDQLPKVARRAGQMVRDVQNTSQAFIREMERAADASDTPPLSSVPYAGPAYPAAIEPPAAPVYHETPEPASHALVAEETAMVPHSPETSHSETSHPGQAAP